MASTRCSTRIRWALLASLLLAVVLGLLLLARPQGDGAGGGAQPPPAGDGPLGEADDSCEDACLATTYRTDADVVEAASELVRRYRDGGDCVPCQAGYLDLAGNAWGCVLQGPGWVDLCMVRQDGEAGSVVRTVRLQADDGEEIHGQGE